MTTTGGATTTPRLRDNVMPEIRKKLCSPFRRGNSVNTLYKHLHRETTAFLKWEQPPRNSETNEYSP